MPLTYAYHTHQTVKRQIQDWVRLPAVKTALIILLSPRLASCSGLNTALLSVPGAGPRGWLEAMQGHFTAVLIRLKVVSISTTFTSVNQGSAYIHRRVPSFKIPRSLVCYYYLAVFCKVTHLTLRTA